MVKLYTIQSARYWIESKEKYLLTGNPNPPDQEPQFANAYSWMMLQMAMRLPYYSGDYPVWAWREEHPFNLEDGWGVSGDGLVRVDFEVPDERVLFSDFMAWHQVLNRDAILLHDDFTEEEMIASWENIFDPSQLALWSDGTEQACVDQLHLHEITNEYYFTV